MIWTVKIFWQNFDELDFDYKFIHFGKPASTGKILMLPKANHPVLFGSDLLHRVDIANHTCFSIAIWIQQDDAPYT